MILRLSNHWEVFKKKSPSLKEETVKAVFTLIGLWKGIYCQNYYLNPTNVVTIIAIYPIEVFWVKDKIGSPETKSPGCFSFKYEHKNIKPLSNSG